MMNIFESFEVLGVSNQSLFFMLHVIHFTTWKYVKAEVIFRFKWVELDFLAFSKSLIQKPNN